MNPLSLFIASALTFLSSPLRAPTPTNPIVFTNLTSTDISQVINTSTGHSFGSVSVGQSLNLPESGFYVFVSDDWDYGKPLQGWIDDVGNIEPVEFSDDDPIYYVGGETSTMALYNPAVYDGDFFINSNNFPFIQSGSSEGSFVYPFTYPSSPYSNKNFTGIYFIRNSNVGNNFNPVVMAFRTSDNLFLPVANNFNWKAPINLYSRADLQDMVDRFSLNLTNRFVGSQVFYYNGMDNRIQFHDLKLLSRDPFVQVSILDDYRYISSTDVSYFAYSEQSNNDVTSTLDGTFNIIAKAIGAALPIFTFVIFPGITLGTFILIPLMFALVLSVIKLVKQ